MLDLNDANLFSDPQTAVAIKKPITVPVRFATQAGVLNTREGSVAYEAGAAICTGIEGEEWPVQQPRFSESYEPLPGTQAGRDGLYRKKRVEVRAKQISADRFFVHVGAHRQPIYGDVGDWLVQYSPEKRSIISDRVFRASYDLISPCPTSD